MIRAILMSMVFLLCSCSGITEQPVVVKDSILKSIGKYAPDNSGMATIGLGYDISGKQVGPPIETLVTDPLGRKTGYDPATMSILSQIPHGGYQQDASIGIDSEEDVPASEQPPAYSEFEVTQPMSGEYKVQIIGKDSGGYELLIHGTTSDAQDNMEQKYFGLTEKGLITEFKLNFNKTPGSVSTIIKVVTFQSLKDDLRLAKQLGYIDNDGILNSLAKKLENAEEQYKKGQKEAAKNMLEALINEVKAQTDKHIRKAFADIFAADIAAFIRTL